MSLINRLGIFFYLALPQWAFAAGREAGIGAFANAALGPIDTLTNAITNISIVMGIAFLVTAVIKYFEYRRSPMMVTVSTIFFFVVAGLILVSLPFLHLFFDRLTSNASGLVK